MLARMFQRRCAEGELRPLVFLAGGAVDPRRDKRARQPLARAPCPDPRCTQRSGKVSSHKQRLFGTPKRLSPKMADTRCHEGAYSEYVSGNSRMQHTFRTAAGLALVAAAAIPADAAVHAWEKQELTLTSARSFQSLYRCTVWVDLTGLNLKQRVYGFWDGGQYVARPPLTS